MISKQIENATKEVQEKYHDARGRYDMSVGEVVELINLSKTEPFDAILAAFDYGFVKGIRYTKATAKKRRSGE